MGDSMVWALNENSREVVWWRYKNQSSAAAASNAPQSGRVCIHTAERTKLRALLAYDVKKPSPSDGIADNVPFLLVASSEGLEAIQLATTDSASPPPAQFKSWSLLQIDPGETTVLGVSSQESHSNVMVCNRAWELVVFRHDLSTEDGNDGEEPASLLDNEPLGFGHASLATRLGIGSTPLGKTLGRFLGSSSSTARPIVMLCCRTTAGGGRLAGRGATGGAGRAALLVTVLAENEIYVWRLAAVEKSRWEAEGFLRLEDSATRSRSAFDACPSGGSSSPAPQQTRQPHSAKQSAPAKLVDMCLQWSCSANGNWAGDACVQVLATAAGGAHCVYFLSPTDLEPIRAPQLLPSQEVEADGKRGASLKMLPCTVTVDGPEACNVHATDGERVLTVRARGGETAPDGGEEDEDWHVGPHVRVSSAVTAVAARERHTHLLVLTGDAIVVLTPSNHIDLRAHGGGEGERLLGALRKAASAIDLERYLTLLVQQAPEKAENAAALLVSRGVDGISMDGSVRPGGAVDPRVLLCVLLEEVQKHVLERAIDERELAAGSNSLSEKNMLTLLLEQKDRQLRQVRAKLEQLMPEWPGLHEALARLSDRVHACAMIFRDPSLVPGGSSVLAQAVQLTVNRREWLGENALRPWAVAWRALAQFCTRVPDVLLGLSAHLEQLQAAPPPLPTLAVTLSDALSVCTLLFDASIKGGSPAMNGSAPAPINGSAARWCSEAAAQEATAMGIEHMVCFSSLRALGHLVALVEDMCSRASVQARSAGLADDPRVFAVKQTLVALQSLHLRLLDDGLRAHSFDTAHVEQAVEYGRVCATRYLARWVQADLDCVAFRVRLAAQLRDVDTLVQVALQELPTREAMCEHNDRFAAELKAEGYAVRLLRALVDTCASDDERGSIWDAPFDKYDFVEDLEGMIQQREAECGASHLGWIAKLRARERCERLGKRFDATAVLSAAAHDIASRGKAEHAPDLHAYMAVQGMARLACEASRRSAAGSSVVLPLGSSTPPLPIDAQVHGALANATVQLRAGGVRRRDLLAGARVDVWDLRTTAEQCAEAAEEQLQAELLGKEGPDRRSEMEQRAGRQRLLELLRDGMTILGHWPHERDETQPSAAWQDVYSRLMRVCVCICAYCTSERVRMRACVTAADFAGRADGARAWCRPQRTRLPPSYLQDTRWRSSSRSKRWRARRQSRWT